MSRMTEVRCDRCRDVVESDVSVLTVEAGPLRRRLGPIGLDLCRTCTAGLTSWLATPELKGLDVEPLRTIVPEIVEA